MAPTTYTSCVLETTRTTETVGRSEKTENTITNTGRNVKNHTACTRTHLWARACACLSLLHHCAHGRSLARLEWPCSVRRIITLWWERWLRAENRPRRRCERSGDEDVFHGVRACVGVRIETVRRVRNDGWGRVENFKPPFPAPRPWPSALCRVGAAERVRSRPAE